MSRKERRNKPARKEFQATPFSSLKSLVVRDTQPIEPEKKIGISLAVPADSGRNLFLQAVADVTPIHTRNTKPVGQSSRTAHPPKTVPKSNATPTADSADELFLAEISRLKLDAKFEDSVPDDGELKPLSGNRLRQVKRGVVSVEYQLDLHGLTREDALAALPPFLRSARRKGQKAVLVITGKGNHSVDEPVLHQAVNSWLRNAGQEHVLEFAPAPREMGGSGAIVLFLRS